MPQSRIFTERQFGRLIERLYPEKLRGFSGWQYELTIIYTHGKDANWVFHRGGSSVAAGVVSDAFRDEKRKILIGAAVLDVKQIVTGAMQSNSLRILPSSPGRDQVVLSSQPPSLALAKCTYEVLVTLAHEFFHMVQYWGDGNMKLSNQQYTSKFSQLREQAKRDNPHWSEERTAAEAHARHPSEKEAEQMAQQQIRLFKAEIDRREWDKYIPVQDIEWYVKRKP